MKPSIGRIVLFKLSETAAAQIEAARKGSPTYAEGFGYPGRTQTGNQARAGQVYPMIITAVWNDTMVNGQVLLDGNDSYWATSVSLGDGEHKWSWPDRLEG